MWQELPGWQRKEDIASLGSTEASSIVGQKCVLSQIGPRAKEQPGIFHRVPLPWEPCGGAKGLPQRKSMGRIAGSLGVREQGGQLAVSNQLEQMGRGPPHLQRAVARSSQREGLPETHRITQWGLITHLPHTEITLVADTLIS